MEHWKAVPNTNEKIFVSDMGRCKSLLRGSERILKMQADNKGYLRIRVTIDRKKMTFKVHREVAKAFIDNPENLPQVNHIDGDKNNNSVNNLEWVTNQENAIHAVKNGLWDSVFKGAQKANELQKKPIVGRCGDITKRFSSVNEAQHFLDSRHITDVLKGKRNHVKGWTFRYAGGD